MGQVEISDFYSWVNFPFSFYAIEATLKRALHIEETDEEKEFRYSPAADKNFAVGVVMRRVGATDSVHTCFLRHDDTDT